MTVTQADVDRLERYVELRQELVNLKDDMPTPAEMKRLTAHLTTMQSLTALEAPSEDEMDRVTTYVEELQELTTLEIPTPEQMQATRQHLGNLQAVDELTDV